jgi:xanthine dehydrogenase accessory factor
MVIGHDGNGHGTIGGGLVEDGVLREARTVLRTRKPKLLSYKLDSTDVTAHGMICGGQATALLEYVDARDENIEFFLSLRSIAKKGERCAYITLYTNAEPTEAWHFVLFRDGMVTGRVSLAAADLDTLKNTSRTSISPINIQIKNLSALVEPMRRVKTMFCFGAGHVALPTARIAALTGFQVVIIDDRPDLAMPERFPEAIVHPISDYTRAFDGLDIDEDAYIVIVTHEHLYDRVVLEGALKTKAGYIGMIASKRKRDTIYKSLLDAGETQGNIDRVHSPIGIEIGAETPEEIAVSIVAEMIKVRAGAGK